jgi:Glycosyl transferase family 2
MGAVAGPAADQEIDISVVIPCLDEARTVADCVAAALAGIEGSGLRGEVIVADNGSTDDSPVRAGAAGARVVHVSRRGYGAALQGGFQAARGRLLAMGDADLSYDFRELPSLVAEHRRTGADIVVGDRLGGRIERGAMPWTHRFIGTPLISLVIRALFHVPLRDCNCGFRLLTRDSHRRLRLNVSTMEYALEMIVQGALIGLRFSQVPITLRVDGRDRAPHLRTLSDGYRSFRFLFQHAPITLYGLVGGLPIGCGLVLLAHAAWLEAHGGRPDGAGAAVGGTLILTGWLLIIMGIIARVFAAGFLGGALDLPLRGLFRVARLESAVAVSLAVLAAGIATSVSFGRSAALFQLGLTLSNAAVGTIVGAFVVSLVGRAVPVEAPDPPSTARPNGTAGHALAAYRTDGGRDLARPRDDGARLAASLRGAWEGARTVFDLGGAGEILSRAAHEPLGPTVVVDPSPGEPAPSLADAAIGLGLLETMEDDVGALRAAAARLRPGGRLGLVVAGGGSRLYGPRDQLEGRVRRYTIPRLRARLRAAGFEVESIRPVDMAGAIRWFVAGRVPGAHLWARAGRPMGWAMPLARRIDALLGPPFGLWLVAIATLPGESTPSPVWGSLTPTAVRASRDPGVGAAPPPAG